jgi:hypothetical protein
MIPLRLSLTLLPIFLMVAIIQFFMSDEPSHIAWEARWQAQHDAELENATQQGITTQQLSKKVSECPYNDAREECWWTTRYGNFYEGAYSRNVEILWREQLGYRVLIAVVSAFLIAFGSIYTIKIIRSVGWPWVRSVWWPWVRGQEAERNRRGVAKEADPLREVMDGRH